MSDLVKNLQACKRISATYMMPSDLKPNPAVSPYIFYSGQANPWCKLI